MSSGVFCYLAPFMTLLLWTRKTLKSIFKSCFIPSLSLGMWKSKKGTTCFSTKWNETFYHLPLKQPLWWVGFQCTGVILVWFPSVNRSLWPCTADSWWEPGKNHWGPVRAWIIPLGAENPETARQAPKAKQRLSQHSDSSPVPAFSFPPLFMSVTSEWSQSSGC